MKIILYLIIILTGILLINFEYIVDNNIDLVLGWVILTLGFINLINELYKLKKK